MKATIRQIDTTASASMHQARLPATGTTLRLDRTHAASVSGVLGWRVHALRGQVWITQDGDLRDIVLQPGQDFAFDRPGPALLWPLGDDDVCVSVRPLDTGLARETAVIPAGHPAFA